MSKLFISKQDRKLIESILTGDYQVLVFGSRVKGNHQKFSDLDVCLKAKEKLSDLEISDIKEKFTQSNLPYKVDVVDYHRVSKSFQTLLDHEAVDFF